jgi:hypothetical protein
LIGEPLANQSKHHPLKPKDDGCESADNLGLIDGTFKPSHVVTVKTI